MDKKYPVACPTISVNIDDWLQERQQPQDYSTSVQEMAQDQIDQWHQRNERAAREALLAENATECSECGTMERPYKDDYMCYKCRDTLDS